LQHRRGEAVGSRVRVSAMAVVRDSILLMQMVTSYVCGLVEAGWQLVSLSWSNESPGIH
jgi:hypothetical protein